MWGALKEYAMTWLRPAVDVGTKAWESTLDLGTQFLLILHDTRSTIWNSC